MAESENKPEHEFKQLTERSVSELYTWFLRMDKSERLNRIQAWFLAKSFAQKSDPEAVKSEDVRLEYLKEYGRNERAIIKGAGMEGDDNDDPLFPK